MRVVANGQRDRVVFEHGIDRTHVHVHCKVDWIKCCWNVSEYFTWTGSSKLSESLQLSTVFTVVTRRKLLQMIIQNVFFQFGVRTLYSRLSYWTLNHSATTTNPHVHYTSCRQCGICAHLGTSRRSQSHRQDLGITLIFWMDYLTVNSIKNIQETRIENLKYKQKSSQRLK